MPQDNTYNGFANRQTWNVALWINNDEGLYRLAQGCEDYQEFVATMRDAFLTETPDHVAYNDSGLDVERLDELIAEL